MAERIRWVAQWEDAARGDAEEKEKSREERLSQAIGTLFRTEKQVALATELRERAVMRTERVEYLEVIQEAISGADVDERPPEEKEETIGDLRWDETEVGRVHLPMEMFTTSRRRAERGTPLLVDKLKR